MDKRQATVDAETAADMLQVNTHRVYQLIKSGHLQARTYMPPAKDGGTMCRAKHAITLDSVQKRRDWKIEDLQLQLEGFNSGKIPTTRTPAPKSSL